MTAPRSTYRRRRAGGSIAVPKYVAQWFAGERAISIQAAGPGSVHLREWWAAWKTTHPDAVPPANFELFAKNGDELRRFLARRRADD